MKFLDWLLSRTPGPDDPAPIVTITIREGPTLKRMAFEPDMQAIERSDRIDHAEIAGVAGLKLENADAADCGDAFCILDYSDAKGDHSERRVSLKSAIERDGRIYINAFCFERRAFRQFRFDRINHVITDDGEVIPAETFFRDTIGLRLRTEDAGEIRTRETVDAYMKAIRPGLAVLTAAARADGRVHLAEVDTIQIWTEREMIAIHREGTVMAAPGIDVVEAVARKVAVMRPMLPGLSAHVAALRNWPQHRLDRLRRALVGTIEADGVVVDEETDLLFAIERGLDGGAMRMEKPGDHSRVLNGHRICITGPTEMCSRCEIKAMIENNGGGVCGTVDTQTTLLIIGSGRPEEVSQRKIGAARKAGIRIVTEAEFLALLGEARG